MTQLRPKAARVAVSAGLAVMALLFNSGCAALTSVWWSTSLPGGKDTEGKVVHLDAKQRVVLSKAGFACAEPSPDALSAFASSMGLGIALPNQASASFAQALQESSASIGLRTQSITLMRDALYRICEGSYNGTLNQPQVMTLLARTQDLTLGVLAVEQLTGVVAAQQVALGGSASASASAALSTNQQLLEQARKNETEKANELSSKKAEVTKKKEDIAGIDTEIVRLTTERNKLPQNDPNRPTYDAQIATETRKKAAAEAELDNLKQQETSAAKSAEDATKARDAIERNFAVALTQAHAAASGFGQFGGPNPSIVKLNDESTQHIAKAVEGIVTAIIHRSHAEEACLALVSSGYREQKAELDLKIQQEAPGPAKSRLEKDKEALEQARDYCLKVFAAAFETPRTPPPSARGIQRPR